MKGVKQFLLRIRDVYEIAVPMIAFSILFLSFVYSIVLRYVFNNPPEWSNEVQVFGYIWTVLPAAVYIRRLDGHVRFTMVYDLLNAKWQRIMRIFGNLLIGVPYLFLVIPSINYIRRQTMMSMSLHLPVKIYFFPIILLVCGVLAYSFYDVYVDVKAILDDRKAAPVLSESEHAVPADLEEEYSR